MNNRFLKTGSYEFALRIIAVVQDLQAEQGETMINKQLLWTGTMIGARIAESEENENAHSTTAGLRIARKEARECLYWLNLLRDSKMLAEETAEELILDAEELINMLSASLEITRDKTRLEPTGITRH